MNELQLATARSRTYGLISEILLDGWTERAVGVVRGLPWADVLPDDPEQRAVRHQQVFGRAVPPYASVFLSADGLMGGDVAGAVRQTYDRIGFPASRTDVEPDHAGVLAAAMAYLTGAEADALRDGVAVEGIRARQGDVLAAHLVPWVGFFATAVRRQGVAEASEVAGLLEDLVVGQGGEPEPAADAEELLSDPGVGLKAVARYLLVPARSGLWLSLHDIQRLADRAELACGFGRRVQMMESLWFSAVDHGRVPELLQVFRDELTVWGDTPRTRATRAMLDELGTSVEHLRKEDDDDVG